MRKIEISPKTKKSLIITGSALICVGVAAIALTLNSGIQAAEPAPNTASSPSSSSLTVSVAPIMELADTSTASQTPAFIPSSGASQSMELTKIEKPTSMPPKPVIEGDSSTASNGTKTQPTNPALTDKNHKPSYTSKPTASAASKPAPSKPSASQPTTNTPKNGEVRNGKTYDPDFGWIDGTGGGQGTTASDMYEDGVKVGIMD